MTGDYFLKRDRLTKIVMQDIKPFLGIYKREMINISS
jgi:hypothetical protein